MQQNAICSKAVHCANMTFTRRTEVNLSDGRYHRSARGEGGLVTETQWHLQFSRKGKRSQARKVTCHYVLGRRRREYGHRLVFASNMRIIEGQ